MSLRLAILSALVALPAAIEAKSVPANLQAFYKKVSSQPCKKAFESGFDDGQGNSNFVYCADYESDNLIYLSSSSKAELADMDVDCDGANNSAGKCSNDPSGQGQTAFEDTVKSYGIDDLDANLHPYVVFGNEGDSPSFSPEDVGMHPLSVMAVVCNGQLFYGIWGDTNGGTLIGEASMSLASACFPDEGLSGDNGHGGHDVLYLGFLDKKAVPGKGGAHWNAGSTKEFMSSIESLGDSLVKGVPSS